jgi:hypothetical protein
MITLSSLVKAYRNMMESLGNGSLLLPVNTVTTSSSFLSWAQSVFPAVESLSAKIQGTTNNNTGKTTKTDSIDDGATEAGDGNIDDAGSVQSGVSAMLPGGSSASSSSTGQLAAAAAAWLSEALCLCIHISGLVPLKSKSGEVHGSTASLVLPSWASSATPSDLLCISLSIDAASDAAAGKNTAPFARVLIQALKLVTPRGNLQENEDDGKTTTSSDSTRALTTSATISAAISYSLSELSKACVVHLKSASVSKTVQKLLTAWTTTGGGGGVSSAMTEATNAVKALLIERTTSAQKSQLISSSSSAGGGKKGGLGLQSSVAGPRLGTGRAASRGKSYAED